MPPSTARRSRKNPELPARSLLCRFRRGRRYFHGHLRWFPCPQLDRRVSSWARSGWKRLQSQSCPKERWQSPASPRDRTACPKLSTSYHLPLRGQFRLPAVCRLANSLPKRRSCYRARRYFPQHCRDFYSFPVNPANRCSRWNRFPRPRYWLRRSKCQTATTAGPRFSPSSNLTRKRPSPSSSPARRLKSFRLQEWVPLDLLDQYPSVANRRAHSLPTLCPPGRSRGNPAFPQ